MGAPPPIPPEELRPGVPPTDLGPAEVVVNDVRYVREGTLFAAMQRVEELEAEVARKTPPHPGAVPQWGTDDWREWARSVRRV